MPGVPFVNVDLFRCVSNVVYKHPMTRYCYTINDWIPVKLLQMVEAHMNDTRRHA